ncbi:hypothetical protein B0T09DRAFT_332768 [Sordaria sp. MPI-SDFR-AT-0083]|nr:hypothetical protein B0T09DRAFT_332768 [Sordaria sp. MPI-SDFR-AT-0083]
MLNSFLLFWSLVTSSRNLCVKLNRLWKYGTTIHTLGPSWQTAFHYKSQPQFYMFHQCHWSGLLLLQSLVPCDTP